MEDEEEEDEEEDHRVRQGEGEHQSLPVEMARLAQENERLRQENARLQQENAQLKQRLDAPAAPSRQPGTRVKDDLSWLEPGEKRAVQCEKEGLQEKLGNPQEWSLYTLTAALVAGHCVEVERILSSRFTRRESDARYVTHYEVELKGGAPVWTIRDGLDKFLRDALRDFEKTHLVAEALYPYVANLVVIEQGKLPGILEQPEKWNAATAAAALNEGLDIGVTRIVSHRYVPANPAGDPSMMRHVRERKEYRLELKSGHQVRMLDHYAKLLPEHVATYEGGWSMFDFEPREWTASLVTDFLSKKGRKDPEQYPTMKIQGLSAAYGADAVNAYSCKFFFSKDPRRVSLILEFDRRRCRAPIGATIKNGITVDLLWQVVETCPCEQYAREFFFFF